MANVKKFIIDDKEIEIPSGGSESLYPLPLVAEVTLEADVTSIEFTADEYEGLKGANQVLYIEAEFQPVSDSTLYPPCQYVGVYVGNNTLGNNKFINKDKATYYQFTATHIGEGRYNSQCISKNGKFESPNGVGANVGQIQFENWHGARAVADNFEYIKLTYGNTYFGKDSTIRVYAR